MRAGPVNGRVDLPGSVGDVPRLRGCGLFVEGFLVVAGKGCRGGGINVERPQPRERCDRHGDECRYTGHSAYRSRWDASPNGSRGSRPTAVEHCTQVSRRQLRDRRSVAAPTVTRSRRHRRLVVSGAGAVPARSPRPGVTPRACQPRLPSRRVVRSPVLSCGARQSHHSAYSKAFRVIAFASCGAPSLLRQRCRIPVSAFPIHVQYCQPASCHLLLSRHIRPSMTTRRLTASPITRGSILRNSSHSVNTRSTSALSHAALAESA